MSKKSDADLPPEPESHIIKGLQQKKVFKIIVLGDSNVGKTCLTFRFCEGHFLQQCEATIGVDFRERTVRIRNEDVKLQLWDTAGQERFRKSMVQHYYRNVHAVVIVYDITKISSFKSINTWMNEVDTHGLHGAPRVLVGNKCDCPENEIAVPTTVAQRFADQYGMPLFETSARLDSECDNVESIFMTLAHKLHSRLPLRVASLEGEMMPNSPSILRLQHKQANNELTLRNIQDSCSCN